MNIQIAEHIFGKYAFGDIPKHDQYVMLGNIVMRFVQVGDYVEARKWDPLNSDTDFVYLLDQFMVSIEPFTVSGPRRAYKVSMYGGWVTKNTNLKQAVSETVLSWLNADDRDIVRDYTNVFEEEDYD